MNKLSPIHYVFAALLLALNGWQAYDIHQNEFYRLLACQGPFFALYLWLCFRQDQDDSSIRFYTVLGIVLRLMLLFSMPLLSDDLYRFIWDGRLLIQGINPFDLLPADYMQQDVPPTGLNQALFDKLNSPEYFTIYPPVCQGVFATACWMYPSSISGAALVMKAALIAMEIGSILLIGRLLQALHLPARNVLFYALNPLIILEISGNLHFEGAMVFFLLLALWWMIKDRLDWSAAAMALSIASKLLPLLFLPLLLRHLGWKKSIRYYFITGLIVLALFIPLFNGAFLSNFGDSLDLYFRKFEFNASLYYLLRWIGFQASGYNLIAFIGPTLAAAVFLSILWLSFRRVADTSLSKLPEFMLYAITIYLFSATTIHPWYVSLPVVLCLFTPYRYPIVWSALIGLTYINYSYEPYHENLWIVGLEYSLVICYFIWERVKRNP
ncbi:MAG: hypothetical protein AAF990_15760 [Bacteroidota bacterium]